MLQSQVSSVAVFVFLVTAIYLLTNLKAGSSNERKYSITIFVLSVAVFLTLSFVYYEFIVDDVYISLRYARNLANGYGLVFNTDDNTPVEGYTNFLWVIIESSLFKMNIPDNWILDIIKIIGMTFGVGILIVTFFLIRMITLDNRIGLTGVLFLAAVPELAFWAVGGLETTMYIFWLLIGIYRYILEKRKGKAYTWSMVFLALMALTRPEGLFFWIAIILWDVINTILARKENQASTTNNFRQIFPGVMIFIVLFGGYFLWRYNFYGYLLPNTFYAKKITYFDQMIHRIKQVSGFVVHLFPFFSIASLGYFYFHKKMKWEKLTLSIMMITLIAFCFAARNEWMPGFRYELPFVPLLMLFFAAGINKIVYVDLKELSPPWKIRITRFGCMLFLGLFMIYPFNDLRKTGNRFSEQLHRAHIPLGKWLKHHAPKDASYASWDMGAVPYYSQLPHIIDINSEGLLNLHTTFHGYDVDNFLSQNPSFLILPPNTSYIRPKEILDFYSNKKFDTDYEFLFSFAFTKDYLLNVYKNRKVVLSDAALIEGKYLAQKSMSDAN